jgi:hypothetical protein
VIGTEIAFRLGPGSVEDARTIAGRLAALAQAAREHVLFVDAERGEFGCLAVWPSAADADAYMASAAVAAEVAEIERRMGTPTRVRRYVMEYQRHAGTADPGSLPD